MDRGAWIAVAVVIIIVLIVGAAFLYSQPSTNSLYSLPQNSGAQTNTTNVSTPSTSGETNSSTASTSVNTTTGTATGTNASTSSGAGTSSSTGASNSSDPFSAFKSLVTSNPEYMVTYSVSGVSSLSQMSEYFKSGKVRTDVSTGGYSAETFILSDGIYSCTQYSGAWTCFKTQKPTASPDSNIRNNINDYNNSVTALPGMTILGQPTSCFGVTRNNVNSVFCYNEKGVPLYIKTATQQATTEFTATAYNDTVADSVFDLPTTPQSVPQGGYGYTYPS